MYMELVSHYGLFLAKAVTVLLFIWVLIAIIVSFAHKHQDDDQIEVRNLSKKYNETRLFMQQNLLSKKEAKKQIKQFKKRIKREC